MRKWLLVLLLVLPVLAQDAATLVKQAEARARAHDYAGALVLYEKAEALEPNDPSIVYNKGLSASLSGNYAVAVTAFSRFRLLEPDNWHGLSKLIQALEGAGHEREAEREVGNLRNLWKSGKNKELSAETSFVREQFRVGKYWVYAFEFFQPNLKEREHTWDFMVYESPSSEKSLAMFYVMFDEMANENVKDKQLYFFDVRSQRGHQTLGVAQRKPTYPEARELMKKAIGGTKIGPIISLP